MHHWVQRRITTVSMFYTSDVDSKAAAGRTRVLVQHENKAWWEHTQARGGQEAFALLPAGI